MEGEAARQLLGELVYMQEAALLAYLSAFGIDTTITRLHRNDMAETLSQLLTVYAVSEDGDRIRRLTSADLQGAVFANSGQFIEYTDLRKPVTGLAVTRSALKAAVAALKDARKT